MALAYDSNYSIPTLTINGDTRINGTTTQTPPELPDESTINSVYITVRYRFKNGDVASDDFTTVVEEGYPYHIPSPQIEGYVPDTPVISGVAPAYIPIEETTVSIVENRLLINVPDTVTGISFPSRVLDQHGKLQVDQTQPYSTNPFSLDENILSVFSKTVLEFTVVYYLQAAAITLTPDYTKINAVMVSTVNVQSPVPIAAFEARATRYGEPYGRGIGADVAKDDVSVDAMGVHSFLNPVYEWTFDVDYSEIGTDGTYRISVYAMNEDGIWNQ